MNPPNIKWDKFDFVPLANGQPFVRHAVSNADGVCFEMFGDDSLIKPIVPERMLQQVEMFQTNNVKIEIPEPNHILALVKCGKTDDPSGHLMLFRFKMRSGYSPERFMTTWAVLVSFIREAGIKPDKNVMDTVRRN